MNRKEWEQNSYLAGLNAPYVEELYDVYLENPASVPENWQQYFQTIADGQSDVSHEAIREGLRERARHWRSLNSGVSVSEAGCGLWPLQLAYRRFGHNSAHFNPLHEKPDLDSHLAPEKYGINAADFKSEIDALQKAYCGSIGFEFDYIDNDEEREWLIHQIENVLPATQFSAEDKKRFLKEIIGADALEKYLDVRYPGQKRFSVEGTDSLIPLLRELTYQAGEHNLHELIIAMAHRGRLNVLLNVMGRASKTLFDEFDGAYEIGFTSGDVKYHMGFSSDVVTPHGDVHMSLMFNPSHLEFISPVAMGSARARQDLHDKSPDYAMPVIMHGDAAFCGQGVVMEFLNMSQTRAYGVGGSVHIITNNQIGFTTNDPRDVRSSQYCSDAGKMISAPVLHVNADDIEAVVKAARLAFMYRTTFHKDIIIDLVGYRRHGHQEVDEPRATQPVMYNFIKSHPVSAEIYARQLVSEGVVTDAQAKQMRETYRDLLDDGKETIDVHHSGIEKQNGAMWQPYVEATWRDTADTSVTKEKLAELGQKITAIPEDYTLHRNVQKIVDSRRKMAAGEMAMDWGFGETMAYATLLAEGVDVRITGEDVRRGTFYHRHARFVDQNTDRDVIPLTNIAKENNANLTIYDSLLSETATMAFEYGYSSADPRSLVIWEAQFGDFANVAQVIVDQFLSSAWQKWQRLAGLVLLLPHGYEGMGPEHSSARLERYLQLCAQNNMQVCMPTTPAQMFHLLRRQAHRKLRTPLIVMTPKSILRHKLAVSSLDDLSNGEFKLIIPETKELDVEKVTRVIACSGKVYYELLQKRQELARNDVAIVRIEQLYPFPYDEMNAVMERYPNVKTLVWCQEEPKNQGAWFWVRDRFAKHINSDITLHYAGRDALAAPACGYPALHKQLQVALVDQAFANVFEQKNIIQF